jgi:hypothetical protein
MNASPPRACCTLLALTLCAALFAPAPARSQALPQAATLDALVDYPDFYTDHLIVVRGVLREGGAGRLSFEDAGGQRVPVLWKGDGRPEGAVDATGQLWDLGRMKQDDPRLAGYDTAPLVGADARNWPRPGDLFVLAVSRFVPADPAALDTIRSLVLEGAQAAGRLVTVRGQFRGRNLFGDLPRSPGVSPSDFVLMSSQAAIWVSGIEPRGKDFALDPGRRVDTGRWLEVTGTVRDGRGLMWIEGRKVDLAAADPAEAGPAAPRLPPAAPPEVIFSVPVQDQTDASPSSTVRIQLSRDLDPASLKGHVRVSYVGAAARMPPEFTLALDERERVLTIQFAQPLERWRTVRVDLVDGIRGTDGQPLKPWTLTFAVGPG